MSTQALDVYRAARAVARKIAIGRTHMVTPGDTPIDPMQKPVGFSEKDIGWVCYRERRAEGDQYVVVMILRTPDARYPAAWPTLDATAREVAIVLGAPDPMPERARDNVTMVYYRWTVSMDRGVMGDLFEAEKLEGSALDGSVSDGKPPAALPATEAPLIPVASVTATRALPSVVAAANASAPQVTPGVSRVVVPPPAPVVSAPVVSAPVVPPPAPVTPAPPAYLNPSKLPWGNL